MRAEDFDQELLLQTLKGDITKLIRQNQQLEKDLDAMDIKIGLLVKNRISVQVHTICDWLRELAASRSEF